MFRLRLTTGNDAFDNGVAIEVARILRETADKLENGVTDSIVLDANGNRVGHYALTGGN
jgi:hypothetical protein